MWQGMCPCLRHPCHQRFWKLLSYRTPHPDGPGLAGQPLQGQGGSRLQWREGWVMSAVGPWEGEGDAGKWVLRWER